MNARVVDLRKIAKSEKERLFAIASKACNEAADNNDLVAQFVCVAALMHLVEEMEQS